MTKLQKCAILNLVLISLKNMPETRPRLTAEEIATMEARHAATLASFDRGYSEDQKRINADKDRHTSYINRVEAGKATIETRYRHNDLKTELVKLEIELAAAGYKNKKDISLNPSVTVDLYQAKLEQLRQLEEQMTADGIEFKPFVSPYSN